MTMNMNACSVHKEATWRAPNVCRVRPKFKLPHYGLDRTYWALAVHQRFKARHGTLLGVNKIEASASDGAAGATGPLAEVPAEGGQSKTFMQRGKQRLQKRPALTEKELQVLMPINQYIDYKIREYMDRQNESQLTMEHLNVRPQFALVLPQPQLGWRIELDLVENPSAIYLLYSSVYCMEQLSQNAATQLVRRAFGPESGKFFIGPDTRQLAIELDAFMASRKSKCGKLPSRLPKPHQFMKTSIRYIFLFCIICGFYIYCL